MEELQMKKRVIALLLAALSLGSTVAFASSDIVKETRETCTAESIEAIINEVENEVYSQYTQQLDSLLATEDYESYNQLSELVLHEKNEAIVEALSEFGAINTSVTITKDLLRSTSNQMTFSETISTVGDLRFYSCDWTFSPPYDSLCDINDIAAARITDSSNYYINSTFAKTWTGGGTQTGYVDDSGNHTPLNSPITKRYEDATGVLFNVDDTVVEVSTIFMPAAKGRISMYIGKKSGVSGFPECKMLTDYHHNYKVYIWDVNATISNVGLTGVSGQLTVTYSSVNKYWQRSSGGKLY